MQIMIGVLEKHIPVLSDVKCKIASSDNQLRIQFTHAQVRPALKLDEWRSDTFLFGCSLLF